MQPLDEETLRWNRKNATILSTVAIAILVVIVFCVINFVPKEEDPRYVMLFSGIAYLVFVIVFSRIWMKWRRKQRAKEKMK